MKRQRVLLEGYSDAIEMDADLGTIHLRVGSGQWAKGSTQSQQAKGTGDRP
jgi:hypothetical protein